VSVLVALVLACFGRPLVPSSAPTLPRNAMKLERDWAGRPVLPVRIAGKWARLLVDSGASSHVLSAEFLEQAQGQKARGEALGVSGLVGDAQPALLLPDLDAQTREGVKLRLREPVVMDYERNGDDGLLSPQLLSERGTVELDLTSGLLILDVAPEPALADTRASRCEPYDNLSLLFVAPARIDGTDVPLLVDTGATYSSIDSGSRVGKQLFKRSTPAGRVSGIGGKTSTRRVEAKVAFAGHELTRELRLVEDRTETCEAVGHLGMDVLQSCRLRFGPTALHALCP
jgi:hypothetical protein